MDLIQEAFNYYPWERSPAEKDDNEKVSPKFIPPKTILCDDRDPPWNNNEIKKPINEKNTAYQSFIKNVKSAQSFQVFQDIQSMLLSAIETSKQQYYSQISKKLSNSSTSPKAYCSLLKTVLNNKKLPCIPPLYHNNKLISNFRVKTELFNNNFFAKQCTLIDNASEIPVKLNIETTKILPSFPVTRADIAKIIKKLDPNKAHGHDMIII